MHFVLYLAKEAMAQNAMPAQPTTHCTNIIQTIASKYQTLRNIIPSQKTKCDTRRSMQEEPFTYSILSLS
jgi:hypothetical protein